VVQDSACTTTFLIDAGVRCIAMGKKSLDAADLWMYALFGGIVLVLAGMGFVALFGVGPSASEPTKDDLVDLDAVADYVPPRGYVCYRADSPIKLDGKLDEPAWQAVPWTEDFVDIQGEQQTSPRFRTRVKMLWDDRAFYIGAELQEPQVQGTYTKHDSYIFHEDNDFEVFLNPDGNNRDYAELEMNALNTTWDLRLRMPYRDGGRAEDEWEIPGLKTAVHVDGTVNDARDVDRGWTIEITVPWEIVPALHTEEKVAIGDPGARPPRDGEQWRVNFSRVEWRFDVVNGRYVRRKDSPEDNWVWSPQGEIDMHQPEKWGYVQFSTKRPGTASFRPDPAGAAKYALYRIYRAQREFYNEHQRYAKDLRELGLAGIGRKLKTSPPYLQTTAGGFLASVNLRLADGTLQTWYMREDSQVLHAHNAPRD
jgi:hypothetical protein